MVSFSQESLSLGCDLNSRPLEDKIGVLLTGLWCYYSVLCPTVGEEQKVLMSTVRQYHTEKYKGW